MNDSPRRSPTRLDAVRPTGSRATASAPETCMLLSRRTLPGISFTVALVLCLGMMPEFLAAGEIQDPPPSQLQGWKARLLDARLHGGPAAIDLTENPDPFAEPTPQTSGASSNAVWAEIPPPALWLHSTIYD